MSVNGVQSKGKLETLEEKHHPSKKNLWRRNAPFDYQMSKPEVNPYKNLEQRHVQSALSSQRSKTYGGFNRLSGSRKARPSEAAMPPDTASAL